MLVSSKWCIMPELLTYQWVCARLRKILHCVGCTSRSTVLTGWGSSLRSRITKWFYSSCILSNIIFTVIKVKRHMGYFRARTWKHRMALVVRESAFWKEYLISRCNNFSVYLFCVLVVMTILMERDDLVVWIAFVYVFNCSAVTIPPPPPKPMKLKIPHWMLSWDDNIRMRKHWYTHHISSS
jgi:hypothetical protein